MAETRHTCRWVSDQKRRAFLGWVNDVAAPQEFLDFDSLRISGYLKDIAFELYSHGETDQTVSLEDVLRTLLSDYYGQNFVDAVTIEVVIEGNAIGKCACEVEFHTAVIVALLLNIALNVNDPRHVRICMKLGNVEQGEIAKTFHFLATEACGRSTPTEKDWKSFLFTPISDCHETPVASRRPLQRQRSIIGDLITGYTQSASPTDSDHLAPASASSSQSPAASPIVQAKCSPVVRSTAKLRDKDVEIQKLKRELAEKTHFGDLEALELATLTENLDAAEREIDAMRITEKNLRYTVQDLRNREDQLVRDLGKACEGQAQVETLTKELEQAKIDKQLFMGLEKERDAIFAELECVTRDRNNLERELRTIQMNSQREIERLEAATEKEKQAVAPLIQKNENLLAEIRKLRDEADELRLQEVVFNKDKKDCELLQQRIIELTDKSAEERHEFSRKLQLLEFELSSVKSERDQLLATIEAMKLQGPDCKPMKRARRASSRSAASTTTFGAGDCNGSVISSRCQSRFDNCEDEDVGMLENPVAPGDGNLRLNLVPANRVDGGMTPATRPHSVFMASEQESEAFKLPLPRSQDNIARSLQFPDQSYIQQQEEVWSDGSVLDKESIETYKTPKDKRLSTLNQRNKLLPAHLKTSYPAETQSLPADVKDEDLKNASNYEPPPSVMEVVDSIPETNAIATDNHKKPVARGRFMETRRSIMNKLINNEPKVAKCTPTPQAIQEELPSDAKFAEGGVAFGVRTTPARKTKIVPPAIFSKKKKMENADSVTSALRKKKK